MSDTSKIVAPLGLEAPKTGGLIFIPNSSLNYSNMYGSLQFEQPLETRGEDSGREGLADDVASAILQIVTNSNTYEVFETKREITHSTTERVIRPVIDVAADAGNILLSPSPEPHIVKRDERPTMVALSAVLRDGALMVGLFVILCLSANVIANRPILDPMVAVLLLVGSSGFYVMGASVEKRDRISGG